MRLRLFFLLSTMLFIVRIVFAQGDGIPDNCEFVPEVANQFIRYEPQNRRLVLVDWNTGEDIRVVASDLDNTVLLGWSVTCRYIAGAVGTSESMDTVVWDVQTGERMGSVSDAHNQPHYITWGPNDYLVVETRNGAILWHVPSYRQSTLTTHFDPVTVRNFSRLRWDAENAQLIANLAGSRRVIYDLNTGLEVPQVAQRTDTSTGNPRSQVIIGGAPYDCGSAGQFAYRYSTGNGLMLSHSASTRSIYVELYIMDAPDEILVVLENNVDISFFQARGWSVDCRYVAASLGRVGEDVSDTYVWDVTTGQRVGILADAREIIHPLYWHPNLPFLLLETRNGAVIWDLPNNSQILLDTGAETALAGQSDIRNFTVYAWAGDLIFLVPATATNTVRAYQIFTGELLGSISLAANIVSISPSPSGNYAILHQTDSEQWFIWNRNTGGITQLAVQANSLRFYFSPSERYLVTSTFDVLVWDLSALAADGSTLRIYPEARIDWDAVFVDEVTLRGNRSQINILTGEISNLDDSNPSLLSLSPLEGETGFDRGGYACRRNIYFNGEVSENPDLYEYSIYDGSTYLFSIQVRNYPSFSPDCRWVYAEVPYFMPNPAYDNAIVDDTHREEMSDYLVFWDVSTGQAVRSFYHPYRYQTYSNVSWSPDSRYAIVQTTEGAHLFNLANNTVSFLVFNSSDDALRSHWSSYWDFERGFVLIEGWSAIYAFSIHNGSFLYEFQANPDTNYSCSYWGCGIHIIENRYLIVQSGGRIGIWNLDTFESWYVSTMVSSSWYRLRFSHLHMSPSGRFLINVRRDGTIAVWDLQNLSPEVDERLPYLVRLQNLGYGFESISFVDDTIVEIQLQDGTSYQLSLLRN